MTTGEFADLVKSMGVRREMNKSELVFSNDMNNTP